MPGSINSNKRNKIYEQITIHTHCDGRGDGDRLGGAAASVSSPDGHPIGARTDPDIPDAATGDHSVLTMPLRCYNRLTIVGRKVDLKVFDKNTRWLARIDACYPDLLECSPTRHGWQFESKTPPLEPLKRLSTRYPRLTFLLDCDWGKKKGLVKAKSGRITSHQISY
jgi:hypothetical protein